MRIVFCCSLTKKVIVRVGGMSSTLADSKCLYNLTLLFDPDVISSDGSDLLYSGVCSNVFGELL